MDASCSIQDSIHVSNLDNKYVSRILGTYQYDRGHGFYVKIVTAVTFLLGDNSV